MIRKYISEIFKAPENVPRKNSLASAESLSLSLKSQASTESITAAETAVTREIARSREENMRRVKRDGDLRVSNSVK